MGINFLSLDLFGWRTLVPAAQKRSSQFRARCLPLTCFYNGDIVPAERIDLMSSVNLISLDFF